MTDPEIRGAVKMLTCGAGLLLEEGQTAARLIVRLYPLAASVASPWARLAQLQPSLTPLLLSLVS